MQFLILATEDDDAFAARTDPERSERYWSAWSGYIDALAASGVMVSAGGNDGETYVGKRLTLYREPTVRFGGQEVGGIRIEAMSDKIAAEPRSSRSAMPASHAISRMAASSLTMTFSPSVCPRGTSRSPAETRFAAKACR